MFRTEQKYFIGNKDAKILLVQLVDGYELENIQKEYAEIQKNTMKEFCFLAIRIEDWNKELAPWSNPAIFGKEDFGDGAKETLKNLEEELQHFRNKTIFLGGYSLSGLFSLWATYNSKTIQGIAAVSPSVWYPGFLEFVKGHSPYAGSIYLSLGKKEEKTKNEMVSKVGMNIRSIYEDLKEKSCSTILEWNEGNHFQEPEIRTAKGFLWLLNKA